MTWQQVFEFVFVTILVKAVFVKLLASAIIDQIKRRFADTPRTHAIMSHFHEQAKNNGHASDDVLQCGEGQCAVFHAA